MGADGGTFDVAAEVACRAVDDHSATVQSGHASLGQQNRRLAAGNLGGGDDDIEAGSLLIDGSLLLGLLFGTQRTGIAALA